MRNAIVLAAGKGTRMKSKRNKVMHEILNKPMIGHVVDHLNAVNVDRIVVVTGHEHESVETYLGDGVDFAFQSRQNGTADAVLHAYQLSEEKGSTLILLGDCALIQPETLREIYDQHEGHDLTLVTSTLTMPGTYRRVVRNNQGEIQKIADHRNLTEQELSIKEVAMGVYCVQNELLFKYLPEIQSGENSDELDLVRLVEIVKENGHSVNAIRVKDHQEFLGVNDRNQLLQSSKWLQQKINQKHMNQGVTLIDPETIYIGPDVTIAEDVTIYPGCHIYGKSSIGTESVLLPNCWFDNAVIGENTTIDSSRITDSEVKNFAKIGPSAHFRMHTVVGNYARIGNFVEFKKTIFGDHSNCAHLTYLGDAQVGSKVNIGCGVVTVNYDGKYKHQTLIGDGAFIGSNANLVAPVNIGKNSVVAAGSTINGDVADGDMAIARPRQEIKPGYGAKYKNKEVK